MTVRLGRKVPTDPVENVKFRREIAKMAAASPEVQADLWALCNRDIFFYINVFGYTLDPRLEPSIRPFILYPFQVEAIQEMCMSIDNGYDLGVVKSRDMGASWLTTTVFAWYWHFKPMKSLLLVSRKEGLVDSPGNSASLFSKIDFFLKYLPGWMMPNFTRTKLRLTNEDNGSAITGESTTGDVARGDRKTCIALDEFASVDNSEAVLAATADASNTRWFVSTPKGTGNSFYDICHSGRTKILKFHWTQDPRKNMGMVKDEEGNWTSPWYEGEKKRRTHPVEIAQELDLDFGGSDYLYFPPDLIDKLEAECRPSTKRGVIDFDEACEPFGFTELGTTGELRIWGEDHPKDKSYYVIGVDVATGTGSSNSVAVVATADGEKVAEFVTADMRPDVFAKHVVAMCKHFKGLSDTGAFLVWEANGPGRVFGDAVREIGYGNVYYRRNEKSIRPGQGMIPGWFSTKEEKISLLGQYRKMLGEGTFVNRSREAVRECREYVFSQAGGLVHARSRSGVDPSGARDNHGDRVIADALAAKLCQNTSNPKIEVGKTAKIGSMAWRRERNLEKKRKARENW